MYSVREYVASIRTKTLFREDVGLYFRKKDIFIDTMNTELSSYLKIRQECILEDLDIKTTIGKMKETTIKEGTHIFIDDNLFGSGRVVKLLSDDLMWVKFKRRTVGTMCNSKSLTTVHDNKKRKIKVIL